SFYYINKSLVHHLLYKQKSFIIIVDQTKIFITMATRCLYFATIMLTASILVLGISAQFECGGNIIGIRAQCITFVQKGGENFPPSESCCAALKGANISCYCKYVTPFIESKISIEKAIYVANACHAQNIPTDKCGSYVIPHPPSSKA
ncbi:hypothetical protein KIW84_013628, partial [Lathyrus oleraceus]